MNANDFLIALTVVLCTAGVTTVICQRLRQPVVLGYILAGVIVGPHVPIPLVADPHIVETLSELGVILLMFSLGLEFSLRKLIRVGPVAGLIAIIQSSFMVWLGFMVGRAFGWSPRESLFVGAIIAISSTTIIAKAFDEEGIRGKLRDLVVAILIVEDLIAILLMTFLTAISSHKDVSLATLAPSMAQLTAFLVGFIVVGLLVVPRAIRFINRLRRPETTLVAAVGLCFGCALLAHTFGYSVALGAFIGGSLVAESGEEKRVETLILPVRDMFAAIFFVSIGMMIDPAILLQQWIPIAVLTFVVIVGKVIGVTFGAFMTGNGTRTSVQAGMSLAQIGEFSFIIAGLGVSLNAIQGFLYPIAIAVSALTTLSTPWLIRLSGPTAAWIDRKLPRPLQTFTALYGTWIEQVRTASPGTGADKRARRLLKLLVLDDASLATIVIVVALSFEQSSQNVSKFLNISSDSARVVVILTAVLISLPFLVGLLRISRGLGVALAEAAFPGTRGTAADLAAAPRRALVVTLQLAVVVLACLPLIALTQPFLPTWTIATGLLMLLLLLGVVFWRSAQNLQGHVKAGAEVIVEALAARIGQGGSMAHDEKLDELNRILPGLGEPVAIRLNERSAAVGKTLADLQVRGRTGASVLAIVRGTEGAIAPTARVVLQSGDLLALAGTQDAVAAAKALLQATSGDSSSPGSAGR